MLQTEAVQLKEELQNRLQQLDMGAAPAPMGARSEAGFVGNLSDDRREFASEPEDAPSVHQFCGTGNPKPETIEVAGKLWGFFASLTPFEPVPPPTTCDDTLGLPPCHFHTLVGNQVSEACWGTQRPASQEEQEDTMYRIN